MLDVILRGGSPRIHARARGACWWRWAHLVDDGTAALDHTDVHATLADALVRVEAVRLIVGDIVERILRNADHPSDGPVAKLAYTEAFVELCETAMELLAGADDTADPESHDHPPTRLTDDTKTREWGTRC